MTVNEEFSGFGLFIRQKEQFEHMCDKNCIRRTRHVRIPQLQIPVRCVFFTASLKSTGLKTSVLERRCFSV